MDCKLYSPKGFKNVGYRIEVGPDGHRWVWVEPGETDNFGAWWPTRREAFLDAADDWASNGAGIVSKDSLTGVLRRLAAVS